MVGVHKPEYLRQLDGLRALSVAAVAWSHWRAYWFQPSFVPWGELGVETFFVISGFLITGILLDNRCETGKWFALKQFYARRFLRIFPVYYATLLVAWLWRTDGMGESWPWHAGYLSNFYFYQHGWQGHVSHFWSLAVEEQFYLCWPFLMIFLPRRFLLPTILAGIVIAPVFEMTVNHLVAHASSVTASVLMPSCMDALGLGALLAYGARRQFPMKRLARILLVAGLFGWALAGSSDAFAALGRLARDCVLGWLVFSAANGFGGPVGGLLGSRPFVYLGKISYGLYLFHNFAASLCGQFIVDLGSPSWLVRLWQTPVLRLAALAGVTVGLASFSWHWFEKPILNLKRRFPYPKEPTAPLNPPRTDIPDWSS